MTILALDFSSSQRGVAVVQPPHDGPFSFQSEVVEAGGRSTKAFHMVGHALAEARVEREDIDTIAVGLGPGSYTGIRASIAIAQGWQLAREVRLIGIGTVEVLAAQAHREGLRGALHIVVDAQRGEFYRSTWDLTDATCREVGPLEIVSREVIDRHLKSRDTVRGPDLKSAFPAASELFPSARVLGVLAMERETGVRGEALKPIYLRETTFVKAPPPRL